MAALMMAGKKHKKGQVKEDGMKHAAMKKNLKKSE